MIFSSFAYEKGAKEGHVVFFEYYFIIKLLVKIP